MSTIFGVHAHCPTVAIPRTFLGEGEADVHLPGETDFSQCETYAADWKLPKDRGVIVANVFNADSRWKVEAVENGVAHFMQRINTQGLDAFATGYHHKYA